MGKKMILALAIVLALGIAGSASTEIVAELDNIRDGELQMVGFELTKGAEIDIEAVGIRQRQSRKLAVYAWILDHETRDLLWSMSLGNTSKARGGSFLRKAEKARFFEAGKYELYMYASDQFYYGAVVRGIKDFYDIMEDLFEDDDDYRDWDDFDWERYLDDCYVRLSSEELSASEVTEFKITGEIPGALIGFTEVGDDEYVRQGFTLDQPMNIRIYALVEHPRGNKNAVDYGWIVNSDTRERVWEMDRFNTERAGGGRKNRKFDDEIRLEKGNYVLHYVTDDSHSWDGFNMNPPHDPVNWGITLLPGVDFKASAFHLTDIEVDRGKPLIDFTRARDNDYHEKAFELTKAATLSVYAIGEYSYSDREFVDYGWIENALTGDVVWEMTRRNTEHAGGGEKNRMYDGPVKLEAGKYVAYYLTDGSHAYRDWNVGRPFDTRAYGLAIYPGRDFDESAFTILKESEVHEGTDILARITRVRDHERRREEFTLDKDTRVRILALGEGQNRRMYDYGWIENVETGRMVWEMRYRRTDHAGGGDKNRVFDGTIELDAGTYEVFYESDGSHSFGDWNTTPPRKPKNWGITITKAD